MGLFDGVLGGIVGGAMASVVNGILEQVTVEPLTLVVNWPGRLRK